MKPMTIKTLPAKTDQKEIGQGLLDLGIAKDTEINGIGMGVLSDGTPYLNQRGLAALCGVQNAHIGTISSQWSETEPKPRIQAIKGILSKIGSETQSAHFEVPHNGIVHYCYPAEVCLSILEYYAFDAGANCQPEARDNFRILAGTKLREMIYSQVGYDPTGRSRFDKWHERIALNYQSAPRGFFSVFNEAETLIYEMIVAGAPVDEKNVVDISIGRHWSKFWDDSGYNERYGDRSKFPHRYPDSHPQAKSNPQEAWCYPLESLGAYREWLQDHYIGGGKFRAYLSEKMKKGTISPSIAQLTISAVEKPQIAGY